MTRLSPRMPAGPGATTAPGLLFKSSPTEEANFKEVDVEKCNKPRRQFQRTVDPFAGEQRQQFAMVCPEMLDQLSPQAAVFWCRVRMSRFGGYQAARGQFFASYDELADVGQFSHRTAVKLTAELEESGWLYVPRRGAPGQSNVYVLSQGPKEAAKRKAQVSRRAESCTSRVQDAAPYSKKVRKKILLPEAVEADASLPLGSAVSASQSDKAAGPDYGPASEEEIPWHPRRPRHMCERCLPAPA